MATLRDRISRVRGATNLPSSGGGSISGRIAATGYVRPESNQAAESVAEDIREGRYQTPGSGLARYALPSLQILHHAGLLERDAASYVSEAQTAGLARLAQPLRVARDFYDDATGRERLSETTEKDGSLSALHAVDQRLEGPAAEVGRFVGDAANPLYLIPGGVAFRAGAGLGLRAAGRLSLAGAVDAAAGGAVQGYDSSAGDTLGDRLGDATRGAALSAPLGAVAGYGLGQLGQVVGRKAAAELAEPAADALRSATADATSRARPRYQFRPEVVQARRTSRRATRAIQSANARESKATRDLLEVGVDRAQARAIADPPVRSASGEQMELFSDPLLVKSITRLVSDGLSAGKWAGGHTVAASRWLASRGAAAFETPRAAAAALIKAFGRGIRKHVPRIWFEYRSFVQSRNVPSRRNVGAVGKGVSPKRLARRVDTLTKQLADAKDAGRSRIKHIKGLHAQQVKRYDDLVKEVRSSLPKAKQHVGLGKFHAVKTPAAFDKALDKLAKQVQRHHAAQARMKELHAMIREVLPVSERARFRERYKALDTDKALGRALRKLDERSRGLEAARVTAENVSVARTGLRKLKSIDEYPEAKPAADALRAVGIDPSQGWTLGTRMNMHRSSPDAQKAVVEAVQAARQALRDAKDAPRRRFVEQVKKNAAEIKRHIARTKKEKFLGEPGDPGVRKSRFISQFFKEYQLQPEAMAEIMGEPFVRHIYTPLRQGKERAYSLIRDTIQNLEDGLRTRGLLEGTLNSTAKKMLGKDAKSIAPIRVNAGGSVRLTRLERMYLYATLKDRETLDLIQRGKKVVLGRDPKRSFDIDEDGMLAIAKSLSDEERGLAEALAESARTLYEPLNATHVRLTGRTLPQNDSYLFRRSGSDPDSTPFDQTIKASDGDQSGKAMSMVMDREQALNRPLVIGNLLIDFDRHVQRAAAYAHMVEPVAGVKALIKGGSSVADDIGLAWGRQRVNWIDRYAQDVIDDVAMFRKPQDGALSALATLVDNTAKGALGLNPAVVLKQLPSYLNAATEMSGTVLARGSAAASPFSAVGKEVRERMVRHSGTVWARYHMHASRVAGVIENKGAHALGGQKNLADKAMRFIQDADQAVISTIWHAAEKEVKRQRPNLPEPQYWAAVREMADQVIRRTQPNFDFVNLSQTARQSRSNAALKLFTMFMSQRNTNYSMVARALATGDPRRIASVLSIVAVAQPAMISAIDQGRSRLYGNKRPDDETAQLRMLDIGLNMAENATSNLYFSGHVVEMARHLRQRYLLGQSYPYRDPQTPVAGQASDLVQGVLAQIDVATRAMGDEPLKQADYDRALRGAERILTGGTGLAGLPVQGPYRVGRGIYRGVTE